MSRVTGEVSDDRSRFLCLTRRCVMCGNVSDTRSCARGVEAARERQLTDTDSSTELTRGGCLKAT